MVSHKLHTRWCVKLGLPRDLCSEINRLIDFECGKHDVGRRKSMAYIDAGGIPIRVAGGSGRYASKASGFVRLKKIHLDARDLLNCLRRFYGEPVPSDAIKAAILHHLLDELEQIIKRHEVEPFKDALHEAVNRLDLLRKHCPREFREVLAFVTKHAGGIVSSVAKEATAVRRH